MPINYNIPPVLHSAMIHAEPQGALTGASVHEQLLEVQQKSWMGGYKNKIINGNFSINQRGVSGTVTLSAGQYGHDRWKAGSSGCTYTFATVENVTTITITAGSLLQIIEGSGLLTGTHILSWQGTSQGKIGAGSYGASGITATVTGGTNLNIEFGTGTLKLVQLEQGSVVTPFESRHIAQELTLCQRYYEPFSVSMVVPPIGTNSIVVIHQYRVFKRTTPTVTRLSNFITSNETSTFIMTNSQTEVSLANSTVGTTGVGGVFTADAEL